MSQEGKGAANKRRHEEAFQAAKDGRFEDIPSDLRLRFYSTFKRYVPTIYQSRQL